jgi:hypothetical protein
MHEICRRRLLQEKPGGPRRLLWYLKPEGAARPWRHKTYRSKPRANQEKMIDRLPKLRVCRVDDIDKVGRLCSPRQ